MGDMMCSAASHIQSGQAKNTYNHKANLAHPGALAGCLEEGIHTDVTLCASSGSMGAHRAVLAARSPVFNSMFSHNLGEKQSATVRIDDMTLESCGALLSFMYGNLKSQDSLKHRSALMRASIKYDICDLREACEASLVDDIDGINVLARLQDSWLYQLKHLRRECLRHLLEFGKIHALREEFDAFLQEIDKDRVVELVQDQTKLLKSTWLVTFGVPSTTREQCHIGHFFVQTLFCEIGHVFVKFCQFGRVPTDSCS